MMIFTDLVILPRLGDAVVCTHTEFQLSVGNPLLSIYVFRVRTLVVLSNPDPTETIPECGSEREKLAPANSSCQNNSGWAWLASELRTMRKPKQSKLVQVMEYKRISALSDDGAGFLPPIWREAHLGNALCPHTWSFR